MKLLQKSKEFFEEIERIYNVHIDKQLLHKFNVEIKEDGSPVTKSDIYFERIIFNGFKHYFGDDVVLIGEESLHDTLQETEWNSVKDSKPIIVVDPIDGTENFCSGLLEWGTSISIYDKGKHINSMLLLPEMNICLRYDKVSEISKRAFSSRINAFSSSLTEDTLNEIKENSSIKRDHQVRIFGCSVYNLYNVAKRNYKEYKTSNPVKAWDLQAGLNIISKCRPEIKILVNKEKYYGQLLNPFKKHSIEIR